MTPASKDEIAAADREAWLNRTARWTAPADQNILIVGADPGSIGEGISDWLAIESMKPNAGVREIVAPPWIELGPENPRGYDLSKEDQVRSFFDMHESTLDGVVTPGIGGFDTLVCCVGKTNMGWFEDQDPAEMIRSIESSLIAPMLIAREFVRRTIDDPTIKRIVFVGSMAHKAVLTASAPYCAAKAGLAHLIRNLGWELTPKGYRIFGINPSNVAGTPMTEETIKGIMQYRGLDREAAERYWGAVNLMPDWLSPGDIGGVVNTILEGSLDYMSGSQLDLNGGQR